MKMVAEMSLYPLDNQPIGQIIDFILQLRKRDGLEVVTNQLSTQLRGDFEDVTRAVNDCMREAMAVEHTVVLVVKYLNRNIEIGRAPSLTPP